MKNKKLKVSSVNLGKFKKDVADQQQDQKKLRKFYMKNSIVTRKDTLKLKKDVCYWIPYVQGMPISKRYVEFSMKMMTYTNRIYQKKYYESWYKKLKANIVELTKRMKFKYEEIPEIIKDYHTSHGWCLRIKDYSFFNFIASDDIINYAFEYLERKRKTHYVDPYDSYEFDKRSRENIESFFDNFSKEAKVESDDWAVDRRTAKRHRKKSVRAGI